MTETEPQARPIHERWSLMEHGGVTFQTLDGDAWLALYARDVAPVTELIAAAGKTHAVLVNLPDGSQVLTCSYPNGHIEASLRSSSDTRERWTPVDLLGGSVEVAP